MKQYIKCPECGEVQVGDHYYHKCQKCKVEILEPSKYVLKAISIRQPWAWLIVNGYKDLENRSTLKNFRGDVLIHASERYDNSWWESKNREDIRKFLKTANYNYGGIVGVATFTGSVTKSDSPWFVGPNAFTIENARPLPFTACKGALGFFNPKID